MLLQALEGKKKTLAVHDLSIPGAITELGEILYAQEKLGHAEEMFTQALEGHEKILGAKYALAYKPALRAMRELGYVHERLDKLDEAGECYSKALSGYEKLFGEEHEDCQKLRISLAVLNRRERNSISDSLHETRNSYRPLGGHDLDGLNGTGNASSQTTPAQEQSHQDSTVFTRKPSAIWNVGLCHGSRRIIAACRSTTYVDLDDKVEDTID
jgi:tetratricopeptide (TPR) repeat protein